MRVIIFAGKRKKLYECGMDMFAENIGEMSYDDFSDNNTGVGKRFPGGPTCTFLGKDVPFLTRFSPKGSISSTIMLIC